MDVFSLEFSLWTSQWHIFSFRLSCSHLENFCISARSKVKVRVKEKCDIFHDGFVCVCTFCFATFVKINDFSVSAHVLFLFQQVVLVVWSHTGEGQSTFKTQPARYLLSFLPLTKSSLLQLPAGGLIRLCDFHLKLIWVTVTSAGSVAVTKIHQGVFKGRRVIMCVCLCLYSSHLMDACG